MRLVPVQLVDDDVQLPLQDVDLALGQLLLAPPQGLLLALLLQRRLGQLLLPRPQLLVGGRAKVGLDPPFRTCVATFTFSLVLS